MRRLTKSLLATARNEKDVENAYRGEFMHYRPDAGITSPFGSDGYAQWADVRALMEFKYDVVLKQRKDLCRVVGQLILYLKKFEIAGHPMPNVMFVGDKSECFALETAAVQRFLTLPIDWTVAPSTGSPALIKALIEDLDVSPLVFDAADFKEVIAKIETLSKGGVHRVKATMTNIGAMFIRWQKDIFVKGSGLTPVEQVDVFLKCLFKPDDVAIHGNNKNILVVEGLKIPVNGHAYNSFIGNFVCGYRPSEIESFYATKDRLVEEDARRRQGAFFTPTIWVDEAHAMLDRELGLNWRDDCIVWDPAAGTGNLTRDYRFKDLIISTAEKPDVDVIKEQEYNLGAAVFAYDFLNPGCDTSFFVEKNLIPDAVDDQLRAAAKSGKRLVFVMNPPYGTANNAGMKGSHKAGIAGNRVNASMRHHGISGSQELYAQFFFQCASLAEIYGFTKVTVATFSSPTFICGGSYRTFRDFWYKRFAYKAGMLFQASHFADVSDTWGIIFTIWSNGTQPNGTLELTLKDVNGFNVEDTGSKSLYNSDDMSASTWVREPTKGLKGVDAPQFSSGLVVKDGSGCRGTLVPKALAYFGNNANDVQHNGQFVCFVSGTSSVGSGLSVIPGSGFMRPVALFAARRLITSGWINAKDEYIQPIDTTDAYLQWNDDAVIYAMMHGSNNCTAMRNVAYKGKQYRIKNHFWWKTLKESKSLYDIPGCGDLFKDTKSETEDSYLATILPTLDLSPEAKACLTILDTLLVGTLPHRESFATSRPELHLTAHDAGIYQLKHLFREYDPEGWKELQVALKALADKLRPGVYDLGFLKR